MNDDYKASVKHKKTNENTSEINEIYDPGKHPNSLANLKPFEKGQSGNPGGRPMKYKKLADALLPYGEKRETKHEWDAKREEFVNVESDYSYREEVLEVIWKKARNGDIKYVELLANLGCLDHN